MSVKTATNVILWSATALGASSSELAAQDIKVTVESESRIAIFEQVGGGDSGVQIVTPLEIRLSNVRWDLGFKTAHIYSERRSAFPGGAGSVSTVSDSVISGTYSAFTGAPDWLGGRRITFALNADINLPTGKEQLTGPEKNAVFDSFLVDQDRFGEGFNVGGGFSSTISISESTLFGLASSFIYRGEYSPDGDNPTRALDPGDHWVTAMQIMHTGERFQGRAGYRLIHEQPTRSNGDAIYERALSHEIFASAAFAVTPTWMAYGSAYYGFRGADRSIDPLTGSLVRPPNDDNGDTVAIAGGIRKAIDQQSSLSLDASYRRRGENDFDEANFSFEPSLERFEVGFDYTRTFRNGWKVDAKASYFEVKEGAILGFAGPQFRGGIFSVGASYAF